MSLRDVESTPHQHGDLLTAISKGMVALLKEFYGRGPTRAKELMRERFVAVIEEMTGQRVIGFMSDARLASSQTAATGLTQRRLFVWNAE